MSIHEPSIRDGHARTRVVRSARPSALLVTSRPVPRTVGLPRHFALLLLIAGGASLVSKNGYTLTGRRDTNHRPT